MVKVTSSDCFWEVQSSLIHDLRVTQLSGVVAAPSADGVMQLVAQFLPEDIARELLQQTDRLTPGGGPSAQRTETIAEDDFCDVGMPHVHKHRQHYPSTNQQQQQQQQPERQAAGPAAHGADTWQQQQQPTSPKAEAAAAAAETRPVSERPMLSSMSTQLSNRSVLYCLVYCLVIWAQHVVRVLLPAAEWYALCLGSSHTSFLTLVMYFKITR
jgi:hypothetical protein